MNRVRLVAAAVLVMAGFALAACGSNPYDRLPGVQPAALGQQQPANTGPATGAGQVQLMASTVEGLGAVLTDQDGHTLYRFSKDKSKPPQATCDNACAETWPPLVSDTPALVAGVEAQLVSWVTRNDGRKQVTVGGWPVYRYAKDTGSGVALGQNVSADWAAITPTGARAASDGSQVSGGQNSSQGTTIGTTQIDGLGAVVTDQNGKTLYLFTKDSRNPAKSTCNGSCATTWPPVLVTGQTTVSGVSEKLIGQVMRSDGAMQLTIGGWPVYTYSKDTAPGQANGHGVGNTWYAMEPNGCRVDPNRTPARGAVQGEQAVATTGGY